MTWYAKRCEHTIHPVYKSTKRYGKPIVSLSISIYLSIYICIRRIYIYRYIYTSILNLCISDSISMYMNELEAIWDIILSKTPIPCGAPDHLHPTPCFPNNDGKWKSVIWWEASPAARRASPGGSVFTGTIPWALWLAGLQCGGFFKCEYPKIDGLWC